MSAPSEHAPPGGPFQPGASFARRLAGLPVLGVGISTEFEAGRTGLDPLRLAEEQPELVRFLEIGADLDRGVDADAQRWVAAGRPTTYHFLDVNLEEPEDLDEAWCHASGELARHLGAAWMCGDAGLWHVGPRDRGHGTLMPPVLCPSSAREMATSVRRLRELVGLEVLPENPPAHVFVGGMHLLEYFALLADEADCGLLLDLAHLAIYQRALGHEPEAGLADFPLERVVEIHVAGGTPFDQGGRTFVEDDHGPAFLPETWDLAAQVIERAPNLRAVVFECERNPLERVVPGFERLRALWASRESTDTSSGRERRRGERPSLPDPDAELPHRRLQRTLFRMQLDGEFAGALRRREPEALASTGLAGSDVDLLVGLDPLAVAADYEDTRARRLVANVAVEFDRSLQVAVEGAARPGGDPGLASAAERFTRSPEFHAAIRDDAVLPLAFGAYLARLTEGVEDATLIAVLALERAMARARREVREPVALREGEIVLAPEATLVQLPEGTHAAVAARSGSHDAAPPPEVDAGAEELVLIVSKSGAWPGALREVAVEPLSAGVAAVLRAAERPLSLTDRKTLAGDLGARPAELEALVGDLRADGALAAGPATRPASSL